MKILVTTIPNIPAYFNAAYNMSVFQVGSYIRKNHPDAEVTCKDMSVLNFTWKDLANLLRREEFDLISILCDYDSIDNLDRLIFYCRELSEYSKLLFFGRLVMQIPAFFKQYNPDFISYSGDFESCISNAIHYISNNQQPSGNCYLCNGEYRDGGPVAPLSADKFEFPDTSEVPYEAYYQLYKDDDSRYCGIPNRKELVVHVSRGCPIGCEFCDVQILQGLQDRRVSVKRVVDYIEENQTKFDYVSFFSAIFTLKKKWLEQFCHLMISRNIKVPWKCVTTVQSLERSDIELMSRAGCFRIGLGIETLEVESKHILPREKLLKTQQLQKLFEKCNSLNIEVNAFLMVGLEGETAEGIENTINFIESSNNRARLSLYTPYQNLHDKMTKWEVSKFNRQTFTDTTAFSREAKQIAYDVLYSRKYRKSEVQEKIDKRL